MDTPAPAPEPVPAASAESTFVEPASFWVRAGAVMIDSVLLSMAGFLSFFLHIPGVPLLIALAYKTIFISQGGQTPGKMAAGIKVIQAEGESVSVGRALGRALSEYISTIVLGVGYLIAAFGEKRALHDYIAGTRVINVEGVSKGRRIAVGALGALTPVAVLAILGAIAFPRFSQLSEKSGEGAAKGMLGSLRAATSIYYGDLEGNYPTALEQLVPKYVENIPTLKLKNHSPSNAVTVYGPEVCSGSKEYGQEIDASKLRDTGGWGYVADPKAACYGQVFVDCTHKDTKGKGWTEY